MQHRQTKSPGPQRLGNLVARTRQQSGISQRSLAREAGLDIATLSRLEQGVYAAPTPVTLRRLSGALAISLVDLYQAAGYFQPYDLLPIADEVADQGGLSQEKASELRANYLSYLFVKIVV